MTSHIHCLLMFLWTAVLAIAAAESDPQAQCVRSRHFDFEGAALKKRAEERRQQQQEASNKREEEEASRRGEEEAKRKQQEEEAKPKQQQEEAKRKQQEEQEQQQRQREQKNNQQQPEKKPCPYTILGIGRDATQAEIKSAYRKVRTIYVLQQSTATFSLLATSRRLLTVPSFRHNNIACNQAPSRQESRLRKE